MECGFRRQADVTGNSQSMFGRPGGTRAGVKVPFDDLLELVHDIEDGLQATDLNVLEIPR